MEEKIITETTSLLTGDNIAVILAACIPAVVSIIGFIVTYFLNKRNFHEEVNKAKVDATLKKISDLPYKVLTTLDYMRKNQNEENYKQISSKMYGELVSMIFSYGSKDAIKIVSSMQETRNLLSNDLDQVKKNQTANTAYFVLLACQIKFDLTGIKICPEYWYKTRLRDYNEKKDELSRVTNRIVHELQLDDFLQVK